MLYTCVHARTMYIRDMYVQYKTTWCSTGRVRSTTLLRPLFYDFSLSRNDRNRGGGYRYKICTVPTPFVCLPDPAVSIHMALSSNPSLSRAGQADIQTVWGPYRSCTDTLPLDYDRCVKEKNRKKVDGVV